MLTSSGCSAVRECKKPEVELPQTYKDTPPDSLTIADIDWWTYYGDPNLRSLIETALTNNRDLLAAVAKIEEMRNLYGASKAQMFPELSGFISGNQETNDYKNGTHLTDPEYSLKASISWEADLFGNLKWSRRQSKSQFLASVEDARAVRMSLIAEVASTYFRLVALDNELTIVKRTLTTRSEGMKLAKLRFEGGLTTETVFQQAKVEYATTASLVPNLEREIEVTKNALAVLIGETPGIDFKRTSLDVDLQLTDSLPLGIPSELLKRRPDLRASEMRLQAAMSNVGVAYTDRFPRLTFRVTGGWENDEVKNILESPFSYVIGTLTGPIFDFGKKKRKYKAAVAAYDQARLGYEQKVLEVFQETSDAVVTYRSVRRSAMLKAELCTAAWKYVDLALLQYQAGSLNYLDVLDAQRRYFDAQIGMSNAVRDEHLALVNLYKSLGGGWSADTDQ